MNGSGEIRGIGWRHQFRANLHSWLGMARRRISFERLPARICWVGLAPSPKLGLAFIEMVRSGELRRRW